MRAALAFSFLAKACGQDDIAFIQHSLSSTVELETDAKADFQKVMEASQTQSSVELAPQLAELMSAITPKSQVSDMIKAGEKKASKPAFERAWKALSEGALKASKPQDLLNEAKEALLQTGAMEEMRQMALAAANHTAKGAVPLDSMNVGFRTSVAPWNNILRMFAMPLVKASFTIFTNFFGPQGNAARLCMGAQVAADSTYGVHTRSEFGGINVFLGPAKWDNVPGWSFGTSGGIDDVRMWDVADFGWTWTLSKVPETVGFHWDVLIIDDETIHAGMLQTGSEVRSEQQTESIPRHGSTWIQHVWCSPHWENTPLVIPDAPPAAVTLNSEPAKPIEKGTVEEWDPDSEAV